MIKKKTKYDVETIAKCLTDKATDEAGAVAFQTFRNEGVEISNDYRIPFHAICAVKVKTSTDEVEVEDSTCVSGDERRPRIDGANNTSINQGTDFDLREGVKAYDGDGKEIPFTVDPSEINTCEVGTFSYTYTAEGVTKDRAITVRQIDNPTISGISETLVVEVNTEFDPLDGVTGTDGNGNDVEVTVEAEEPSEYPYTLCTIGAASIPALENGNAYPLTVHIDWETIPPKDGKSRSIEVYGENVIVGDEPIHGQIGDGAIADDTYEFSAYYSFENCEAGGNEILAICYGDDMKSITWDSLTLIVTGEWQ